MRGAQREARAVISNMLLLLPSLAVAFNVSDGIGFVDTGKTAMKEQKMRSRRCISSCLRAEYFSFALR
jgi:hypothetical protein